MLCYFYRAMPIQESRAVAEKPRDAAVNLVDSIMGVWNQSCILNGGLESFLYFNMGASNQSCILI